MLLLLVLLCTACHPIRGCPESEFVLSADSRLPRWFTVRSDAKRSDVEVELSLATTCQHQGSFVTGV